jgi:hypothetical protein
MIKVGSIVLSLFLVSFNAFTQQYPRNVVLGADTCTAFTIEQSKTLILWNTQRKECFEVSDVLTDKLNLKDSILIEMNNKIIALTKIETSYKNIVLEKDQQVAICEIEKSKLNYEIKKQKRHKILSIGAGIISTSLMTYLWVIK